MERTGSEEGKGVDGWADSESEVLTAVPFSDAGVSMPTGVEMASFSSVMAAVDEMEEEEEELWLYIPLTRYTL